MKLTGKNAVVTGAGSGIGRGIALALAKAGVNVVVADIEEDKVKATADEVAEQGVKSGHFEIDVRDARQVAALADYAWELFGGVDIICNNAGVCAPAAALDTTDADFRWQFEVNAGGVFNGMREFVRRFIKQGRPSYVVNTASHNAIGAPYKGVAAYVGTKHAVLGLTDAFRSEHGDQIGFSVLCPGVINTGIWDAGRNRPAEFGGSYEGDKRNEEAVTTYGMAPERVGELVVQAIQNEDFYIWTHPQDIELVEKRYQEAKKTIESQWPDGPGAEHMLAPDEVI